MITICITGNRPHKVYSYNYDSPCWTPYKNFIKHLILEIYRDGKEKVDVWCGMALGVDQVTALQVLYLKELGYPIHLLCAIPCLDYTSKWFSQESIDTYNYILDNADEVVFVSEEEYSPSCLFERNKYMIKLSDALIATCIDAEGGTYEGVLFARSIGIPSYVIHPETLQIRSDL